MGGIDVSHPQLFVGGYNACERAEVTPQLLGTICSRWIAIFQNTSKKGCAMTHDCDDSHSSCPCFTVQSCGIHSITRRCTSGSGVRSSRVGTRRFPRPQYPIHPGRVRTVDERPPNTTCTEKGASTSENRMCRRLSVFRSPRAAPPPLPPFHQKRYFER